MKKTNPEKRRKSILNKNQWIIHHQSPQTSVIIPKQTLYYYQVQLFTIASGVKNNISFNGVS